MQHYSSKQLNIILNDVEAFLKQKDKLPTKVVYAFAKNKKVIKSELENITEKLKELPKEHTDYSQEIFNVLKECGAKISISPQGREYVSSMETLNLDDYNKSKTKVEKKYKDVINEVDEINSYNKAIEEEKIIQFIPFQINYEDLPNEISGDLLTENILLFIKEDEN